jgi:hypothetical protein
VPPRIHDRVPKVFRAGETVKYHRWFDEHSASDGWQYTIYFNGATDVFNAQGAPDPENVAAFLVTITPTDSEVPPGLYRYVERIKNVTTGEVFSMEEGVVQVEPDLATAPAGYTLSFAEKTLAAIEAEITLRISADVEEYTVQASPLGGGRSFRKTPLVDLQKLRGYYGSMVWRQKNPGKIGQEVRVEFTDETNAADYPPTWVDVTGLPGAGE